MVVIRETPTAVKLYMQSGSQSFKSLRFGQAKVREVAWTNSSGNNSQSTPTPFCGGFPRPNDKFTEIATLDMSYNPTDDKVYALCIEGDSTQLKVYSSKIDFNTGVTTWDLVKSLSPTDRRPVNPCRIAAHGEQFWLANASETGGGTLTAQRISDGALVSTQNKSYGTQGRFLYGVEVDGPQTTFIQKDEAETWHKVQGQAATLARKITPPLEEIWSVVPQDIVPGFSSSHTPIPAGLTFYPIVPVATLYDSDSTPPTLVWNINRRNMAIDAYGAKFSPRIDGLLAAGIESIYCLAETASVFGVSSEVHDLVVERVSIAKSGGVVVFNGDDEVQEFTRAQKSISVAGPSQALPEALWEADRAFIYDPAEEQQYEVASITAADDGQIMELTWR